ncbi:winged helix-turn-helix transcriptional regulator [Aggregicoccus sp. 17bor-14]|uniref:ArsR/SmtB family transcription factor n=1 Tax=Myxococcaceae TaxID=31 RepID=UPI00129C5495|nr:MULTISPECIES: metalloregulator ArsR/SmtB family transcription factor [Myxococcaceae]MBF5041999.1 winged helix-turn-helix transcriptional regulator [Simulacricoccus sp. 17bor-14]MRI87779.1 winged helix-turn-helix transcriptional regulator [Aggregicoccus sp. 17bor-14]
MHTHEQLTAVFSALADPTRRAILAKLAQGEATVSQLAEPFQLAQPTISKHLRVLEAAGLIETGRDAQSRPRRLVPAALKTADAWLQPFREQWEGRFDRLEAHLKKKKASQSDRQRGTR